MLSILFICHDNAAYSQMAAGFARNQSAHKVNVFSAGVKPATGLNKLAVEVMQEDDIDISNNITTSYDEIDVNAIDIVITIGENVLHDNPLLLPGQPLKIDWDIKLSPADKENASLECFRQVREQIRCLVRDFFSQGYLHAFANYLRRDSLILDSLGEGIIAHDLKRRVVYFNKAAELITEYTRAEVIGKDCHKIFIGNFCGAKCSFCSSSIPEISSINYPLDFVTKSGERRQIEVHIQGIHDSSGKLLGVLSSFRDLTREHSLAMRLEKIQKFSGIIGQNKKMLELFELIRSVADSSAPVVIQGESGTGKELVAAAIHNEGTRAKNPFVTVNCGALPEGLLESELFGHVRGAFTGAVRDKKGRFELADGGTIFLDEIGDISPGMQVKLLRVLQEGNFERVGGQKTLRTDVRVISATNKNLQQEIEASRFREDLFYRLCVVPIELPPLRERISDIKLLAENALNIFTRDTDRQDVVISPAAMDVLLSHNWPGNVRELQNAIQYSLVKCKNNLVEIRHLPPNLMRLSQHFNSFQEVSSDLTPLPGRRGSKRKLNKAMVDAAIEAAGGNKAEAAQHLKVGRATLYRFLNGQKKTAE